MNGLQNALEFIDTIVNGEHQSVTAPPSLVLSPRLLAALSA
jgi:hypothetical protein